MRTDAGWGDACILNISSRGLLVHSGHASDRGSVVEVKRGEHVIRARVVWRDGARVGLRADERLSVEQILSRCDCAELRLTASQPHRCCQTHDRSCSQSRLLEYLAFVVVAACVGATAFALVGEALAKPLASVRSALGG